jgi:hypothetical protein
MDFADLSLVDLIAIRQYVINSTSLPAIDRKTVNELNGILLLLDEKIIGLLTGSAFKTYIGYADVQEAKLRAANITNIYSGLKGRK